MGSKAYWTGGNLYYLLTETNSELYERYPEYKKDKLRAEKSYWNKKLKKGEIEMPPKPEIEPEAPQGKDFDDILRLHNISPETVTELSNRGFHVGYIKNKDGEIEYTMPLPNAKGSMKSTPDFDQAVSANIVPSDKIPEDRDHKLIYVFSDAQIDYRRLEDGSLQPIHDESAMAVGRLLCADLSPDLIVNLGDTVDLAVLSRFKPDSDHFRRTLGPSFQRTHDMYAELRSDNPDARIVEVDSNHNTRLKNFMLKYVPDMYGMKRAGADEDEYPVFTYPFLANLRAVDVEWVSGYGGAELVYGEEYDTPPIIFKHGNIMVSAGSTANKESKENPETHVVRGHGHRMEMHTRTNRAGDYLTSIMVGVMCKTTGEVASYHSAVDDRGNVVKNQENWQNGVLVIKDYGGIYQFDHVPINKGVIHYDGKRYEA